MVLKDKKILLGVSGGIAAYKSALIVRQFIKAGAHVQVVMTPESCDFVTPLTLSTLSKNSVFSTFYNEEDKNAKWNNHVALALDADLMLIAPATAKTLSNMANGNCDNLLIACYLSAKCPVYFAPAMDLDMYKHPSTLASLKTLKSFGNFIIPAETGELASGLSGQGRMAKPENIIEFIKNHLKSQLPLNGKKILITAGPTYEAIDPVRFIGNYSTGKMGFDIANCAANLGATITLVSGPTRCNIQNSSIRLISVESAQQMYEVCHQNFNDCDVMIAAAAVSDYRPIVTASQKIKKNENHLIIKFKKTKDILASLGVKKKNQYLIGFALETEKEIENAKLKIQKKNLDLIVLNSLSDEGAGFGKPTNKVTFIDSNFKIEPMELMPKEQVATLIMNKVIQFYNE